MGQALYRKYRTKTFAETVGQEHITTTLQNALAKGRISHAYLLTGPKGVGKTSIARILAHEINGLPYDDEAHLDIIEIDAASNRRIDEIRDLRDRVATAPASARYKVYIIDEVHMLTKEAFNALLKTLEEPPAHVVFILATTEAHKLPETIISRTQRYSFRPVPKEQVITHLAYIAKQENIAIDSDALELIAEHGDGSFRDSISLLDQASSISEHITKSEIESMLGLAPKEHITALQTAMAAHAANPILETLNTLYGQGYEPAMVALQLSSSLREQLLTEPAQVDIQATLSLLQKLLDVPAARAPKQLLELLVLETVFQGQQSAAIVVLPSIQSVEPKVKTSSKPVAALVDTPVKPAAAPKPATEKAESSVTEEPAKKVHATFESSPQVLELWQETLNEIKKQYNTLYGIARMATPELKGETLTLNLKFVFHQKRLNEPKNRQIITEVLQRLSGQPLEIACVVADKPIPALPQTGPPDVSTISNIFGGAELLES